MRGLHDEQTDLFSYVQLEDRIPQSHPLRKIRQLVDLVLATMDKLFDSLHLHIERPLIPPEQLLRVSLLQVLYSIRSERKLVEQLDCNLLFRWFSTYPSMTVFGTTLPSRRTATVCSPRRWPALSSRGSAAWPSGAS